MHHTHKHSHTHTHTHTHTHSYAQYPVLKKSWTKDFKENNNYPPKNTNNQVKIAYNVLHIITVKSTNYVESNNMFSVQLKYN